ncbi:MAG: archease [candidate division Zixibacteria bacterium]
MRKFEINDSLSVTDIGIDISGDSLEELYIAGAEGMFNIILENPGWQKEMAREIELSSGTADELLIDWLSELLYSFDAEGLIATDFELSIAEKTEELCLSAKVHFRKFDSNIDVAKNEIKAVTYYRVNIKREGNIYSTPVIFDL